MGSSGHVRLLALERWAADRVSGWRPGVALLVGALGVAASGALDYGIFQAVGNEFAVTALYVAPVGMAAWAAGRRSGWFVAGLATAVEATVASARLGGVTSPWAFGVGVFLELLVILGVADVFSFVRLRLESERLNSRTDALTGIGNARGLADAATRELERARRRSAPISVVYLDVDDLKAVNDGRGHGAGDALLRSVGASLRSSIRGHDVAARIGGDEFALILTETGPDQARFAVERVRHRVLQDLQAWGFSNTVSVGVATFLAPPSTVEELIGVTDRAMYSVKREKKDGIRYEVVAAPASPTGPPWASQRAGAQGL